ncbi:MAG: S8 family serine peptidase [Kineosporiaceae bacterium]
MRVRRSLVVGAVATTVAAALSAGVAGPSAAASSKGAKVNTLGVKVVRFAPGTTKARMLAAVQAAGGEVVTDLSKQNRLAVYAPAAGFDAAVRKEAGVAAVWGDRVIPIGYADAAGAASTGGSPQLGSPGTNGIPDPWHDLDSFLDQNAPGVLQWDDDANGARGAWPTTTGDRTVKVAVLDTGVTGSHKELSANFDQQNSTNTIPCNLLTRQFGSMGQKDCSNVDTEGHGTWVASRIAGAVNGFASNGIAPGVSVMGYKVLSTTLGGGLTSWILDGMYRACDADADLINMSLGGYNRLGVDDEDTLMWADAVDYCRSKGTAIIASAGNEHVRINRVNLTVGGRALSGVGQVSAGFDGIQSIVPGDTLANNDLRSLIETPAGVPGVIMVSAASNANGTPQPGSVDFLASKPTPGAKDQLTYYSNYGSRIDISAPGGARKLGLPRYDGGAQDVLYGGWGELGALTANGEICQDPSLASFLTFSCFKVTGSAFGWLQGTSMSAPNATGVAALVLSAKHGVQENPDGLLSALQSTARTGMANQTGPNSSDTGPSAAGVACASGYCHVQFFPGGGNPITFSDAYGAGMVDAAAAVR